MRRLVPYVGEKQIARADSEQERSKRAAGRVIDEVVSTESGESSWDDLVAADWMTSATEADRTVSVGLSGGGTPRMKTPNEKKPAPATNKTMLSRMVKSPAHTPVRSSTILYADGPSLDWVIINNGHGLRINVSGNFDQSMRKEWQRMLDETAASGAEEFELNLSRSPALSLTGLGMLLLFKERKKASREGIKLYNCNKEVSQVLHWTGMDKYFLIQSLQPVDS